MVRNISEVQTLEGWFDWQGFYDQIAEEIKDEDEVIEIGIFHGKSTIYLAKKLQELKKKVKITAIDPFLKDFGWGNYSKETTSQNFKDFGVEKMITLIENYSLKVDDYFKNNSLFMVMLDGDHSYNTVYSELLRYYPKVKTGGYICGHDATGVENGNMFIGPVFHAVYNFCYENRLDFKIHYDVSKNNRGIGFFYIKK